MNTFLIMMYKRIIYVNIRLLLQDALLIFVRDQWFLWYVSIKLCLACFLPWQLSDKSFLMLSNHLRFGLPLVLFPGTSITITLLPTYFSSLLNACMPIPLQSTFLHFLGYISPTFVVPLILSLLILSSLVTPLIHLNILISTTSNFFSCFLHCACPGIAHHCLSYNRLV